jgi:hypothetical protein
MISDAELMSAPNVDGAPGMYVLSGCSRSAASAAAGST